MQTSGAPGLRIGARSSPFTGVLSEPKPEPQGRVSRCDAARLTVVVEPSQPQHGVPLVLQGLGCFLVGSYVIQDAPRGAVMKRVSGFENDLRVTAVWGPEGRTSLLRPFLAGLPKLSNRAR